MFYVINISTIPLALPREAKSYDTRSVCVQQSPEKTDEYICIKDHKYYFIHCSAIVHDIKFQTYMAAIFGEDR